MTMEQLREELERKGYTEHARYTFDELMIPLREGLAAGNGYFWWFVAFVTAACALIFGFGFYWLRTGVLDLDTFMTRTLYGTAATLLLIPLHEGIHGIMFRMLGAKDVRYGVIWRKLMFYAVGHGFVTRFAHFRAIALAPFVVISIGLLGAAYFVPPDWQAFLFGTFAFHTLCCIGDFGLCGYMHQFRHQNPVTFDDADARMSYFYVTLP